MDISQWKSFLKQESRRVINVYNQRDKFKKKSVWEYNEIPLNAVELQWLGNPGASEEQIRAAEQRLKTNLPPSYRNFLRATNGWEGWNYCEGGSFYSSDKIVWFRQDNQSVIDSNIKFEERFPDAVELDDRKYFSYSPDQFAYRARHLQQCLLINDHSKVDNAYILLNPNVIHDDEWEAWAMFEGEVRRWISFEAMFKEIGVAGEWLEELQAS